MIQPGWLCDFLLTALVIQQRSFLTFRCFSSWLLRENHGCVELQSFEGTMEQSSLFFMRFGSLGDLKQTQRTVELGVGSQWASVC